MNRRGCAVCVGDTFFNKIPVVIEESRCCFGRNLLDAARFRIVEVYDEQLTIHGKGLQAVSCIVCVRPASAFRHIAIEVVIELRILVKGVCSPVSRISNFIIAVNGGSPRNFSRSHLAAVIVAKRVGVSVCRSVESIISVDETFHLNTIDGIRYAGYERTAVSVA